MRLLPALAGLTISFAVPVLAQEQNTVEPEVRQQIEALFKKLDDAYGKNDLAAITARYTQDAVQMISWFTDGTSVGRAAIEKWYRVEFASTPYGLISKLVQVHAIGNEISTITEWSATHTMGQAVTVWVRDADTFKIRLIYVKER
jgi:ketosteroid isomerase-like protein